ncbi:ABC transporter [Carpediemonas membranifera]|uniref:ABC transporter n=1 Tax=Carpediemonas membranifera TaxID=201153 RepID=A0A8J6E261_9EUKA|nr:ABC transporter [Carpediemonas membranifera]|eukprot:KAG9397224.1 ABC transporter [Carpediemonas membranifera]
MADTDATVPHEPPKVTEEVRTSHSPAPEFQTIRSSPTPDKLTTLEIEEEQGNQFMRIMGLVFGPFLRECWAILIQTVFLLVKDALVSIRSVGATAFHILNPILFIFAVWVIQQALAAFDLFPASYGSDDKFSVDYQAYDVPVCTPGSSGNCYTLMAIPSTSTYTSLLTEFASYAGLPAATVAPVNDDITDAASFDSYMSSEEKRNSTLFAVEFTSYDLAGAGVEYVLHYDQNYWTCSSMSASECTSPYEWLELPMLNALDAFFAGKITGLDVTFDLGDNLLPPHPGQDDFQIFSVFGSMVLFAIFSIHTVIFSAQIVTEKENRIRAYMKVVGLRTISYWASFIIYMSVIITLNIIVLIISGWCFRFRMFTETNVLLLFVCFATYGYSIIALCILIAAVVKTSRLASLASFAFLIVSCVLAPMASGLLFAILQNDDTPVNNVVMKILEAISPLLFYQNVEKLNAVSDGVSDPLTFSDLEWTNDTEEVTFLRGNVLMIVYSTIYFIVAFYLDSISDANGVGKHPLWPLIPWKVFTFLEPLVNRYWNRIRGRIHIPLLSEPAWPPLDDEDIHAEVRAVHEAGPDTPLVVKDLVKRFRKFPVVRSPKDFVAVKGMNMMVKPNELLCLLGPNGAGKTTTISMMSGLFAPTAGDGLVYGRSISTEMHVVRKMTGMCPQHDVCTFQQLTASEHIMLFAAIKGLSIRQLRREIKDRIADVNLQDQARSRVSSFSGGMRRRLSIAISLIGSPRLIFLDEPTTGLDPVVRAAIWAIIMKQKEQSAIVLTTHSMEEADVLGDRIAIMAFGRNRCIGTSIRLKTRFGAGYKIVLSPKDAVEADMATVCRELYQQIAQSVPEVVLDSVDQRTMHISLPKEANDRVPELLAAIEAIKARIGDMAIELSTLEDVFITVAKTSQAEEFGSDDKDDLPDASVDLSASQTPYNGRSEHPSMGNMAPSPAWQSDHDLETIQSSDEA